MDIQLRMITTLGLLPVLDGDTVRSEPSHIHIPRPSRMNRSAARRAVRLTGDTTTRQLEDDCASSTR